MEQSILELAACGLEKGRALLCCSAALVTPGHLMVAQDSDCL